MNQECKVGILGVGHALPKNVLTNKQLEDIVDTSDEWIRQRTGIEERRIMSDDESLLGLAVDAAKEAIESSGVDPKLISHIRVGVNTHLRFPSLASLVQRELDIPDASASDVSAGCSAFVFGFEEAYNYLVVQKIYHKRDTYSLVIGADALSKVTDWSERQTCILFGDGAGAVVLGPVDSGEILATFTRTQGKYADLLYLDKFLSSSLEDSNQMKMKTREGIVYPYLKMEGRKVFAVAVKSLMHDVRAVIDRYNISAPEPISLDDIDYVIPHQANLRIVSAVQAGLKLEDSQVYRAGVVKYGNTSAASIPIGYVEELGKRPGTLQVDVAFGSGFASGAILRREAE
jgi:3-oxoacyl-[acyl-carrier-protein] synthase-3